MKDSLVVLLLIGFAILCEGTDKKKKKVRVRDLETEFDEHDVEFVEILDQVDDIVERGERVHVIHIPNEKSQPFRVSYLY